MAWSTHAPVVACPAGGWRDRLLRLVLLPAGAYTFTLTQSTGARLWVNAGLVLDRWASSGTATVTVTLPPGTYELRLELQQATAAPGAVALAWTPLPPTATATPPPTRTPTRPRNTEREKLAIARKSPCAILRGGTRESDSTHGYRVQRQNRVHRATFALLQKLRHTL